MYIDSIDIENFRVFSSATARLVNPDANGSLRIPNVTLLLGNNGRGKTSLLQAICLSILAPVLGGAVGFDANYLVRRFGPVTVHSRIRAKLVASLRLRYIDIKDERVVDVRANLRATATGQDRFEKFTDKWSEQLWDTESAGFFLAAYGATRRSDSSPQDMQSTFKQRMSRYQRVATIFEGDAALVPPAGWLTALFNKDPLRFAEVRHLVNSLLPKGLGIEFAAVSGDDVLFLCGDENIPLRALSDGYRAFLGWLTDLLCHLLAIVKLGQKLTDIPGVVLIDEIDLHLHPAWQRVVIKDLSITFPRMQFVLTSHSPLVVGTLERSNVLVMHGSGITPLEEDMRGWSADQILTSDAFGLESTRDPEVFDEMILLAQNASSGDVHAADRLMQMLASGALPDGQNLNSDRS